MVEMARSTQTEEVANVERLNRVAELKGFAVGTVENYYRELSSNKDIGLSKLKKTKDFFTKQDTLQRVLNVYNELLPSSGQIADEDLAMLKGHLSFVLKRGFDQHVDNPGKYVSHGFNHTLNVVGYADSIMTTFPEIVTKVEEKYSLSEQRAKFLLRNVALFHDFGYPISELRQLKKENHSVTGAGVLNNSQTEVVGKKMSVRNLLVNIFNEDAAKDLIDSVAKHNADKVENFYPMKIDIGDASFLSLGEDTEEVYKAGKELGGTGIKRIFVCFDNPVEGKNFAVDFAARFMRTAFNQGDSSVDLPEIVVESGKGYKGRSFGKNNVLGLEYSEVTLMDDPLSAVIRLADNMDIAASRFSDLQREPLFQAYYTELGKPDSYFYKNNQNIEVVLKQVKTGERTFDDLRKTVVSNMTLESVRQSEKNLINREMSKKEVEKVITDQWSNFYNKWMEILKDADVDGCVTCWREFVVDQIALRPEFEQIDDETKLEIKEAAVKMNSKEFRHFGGCKAVRKVGISKRGIEVSVDKELYDELNKTIVRDEVKVGDGQISFIDIPVGEYQIRRMWDALESIRYGSGTSRFHIYVNDEEYLVA